MAGRAWPVAAGVLLGAIVALLAFAPASWIAGMLERGTGGRLLLADARGTVWAGSAVPVLTGGPGSRDASALPGRLEWSVGLDGAALEVRLRHDCCITGTQALRIEPGIGRWRITLPAGGVLRGQWPASWLEGLGTPWNTVQPGGVLRLESGGFGVESAAGRWRLTGGADLVVEGARSRLAPLPTLGSYRLRLRGDDASGGIALELSSAQGPLLLAGRGRFGGGRLQFRGEARAAEGAELALGNLLNIIGRRQGALAVIAIG